MYLDKLMNERHIQEEASLRSRGKTEQKTNERNSERDESK